jgi:hypothetical protein
LNKTSRAGIINSNNNKGNKQAKYFSNREDNVKNTILEEVPPEWKSESEIM